MSVIQRTTAPVALARKARHRRPRLCTCCTRHILIQLAQRRWVRALIVIALAAGIIFDLRAAAQFGLM
jgi:hypothetical protein